MGVDSRLVLAKERLDRLDWWPRPVRIAWVRIVVAPWLFTLPPWKPYDGFATHLVIFLRRDDVSNELVTHELCHVWQLQHRPLRMPLSYLRTGYRRSPYERQARAAAARTRQRGATTSPTRTTPGVSTEPHTPKGSGSSLGTSAR